MKVELDCGACDYGTGQSATLPLLRTTRRADATAGQLLLGLEMKLFKFCRC